MSSYATWSYIYLYIYHNDQPMNWIYRLKYIPLPWMRGCRHWRRHGAPKKRQRNRSPLNPSHRSSNRRLRSPWCTCWWVSWCLGCFDMISESFHMGLMVNQPDWWWNFVFYNFVVIFVCHCFGQHFAGVFFGFCAPESLFGSDSGRWYTTLGCRDYEIYEVAHDGIKDEVKSYHGSLIGESSMLTWFMKVYLSLGLLIRCVWNLNLVHCQLLHPPMQVWDTCRWCLDRSPSKSYKLSRELRCPMEKEHNLPNLASKVLY